MKELQYEYDCTRRGNYPIVQRILSSQELIFANFFLKFVFCLLNCDNEGDLNLLKK